MVQFGEAQETSKRVNPFQNPYRNGDVVLPELASAYLDRAWRRPGMITPGGPAVRAFASIGRKWGGDWSSLKDYQHFSATRPLSTAPERSPSMGAGHQVRVLRSPGQ